MRARGIVVRSSLFVLRHSWWARRASFGEARRTKNEQRTTNDAATHLIADVLARGYTARFTASGNSMHPFIRSGQRLVVEPVDPRALRRGDVVLARLERGLTAHRVVRVERRGDEVVSITTRGDNCPGDDPPFAPAQLVGRIARQPLGNLVTIIALARHWVRRARG
jgi:signal peptidase I